MAIFMVVQITRVVDTFANSNFGEVILSNYKTEAEQFTSVLHEIER